MFWLKIGLAALVGLIGLSGTYRPWFLGERNVGDRLLSLSGTFTGGVLGGAGAIRLLSSGLAGFGDALPSVDYPVALPLAGAGFLLILLVVLSIHSVTLGLALGAQNGLRSLMIVFLAIVVHKGVAGFALGIKYHRAGFDHRAALSRLALFSAMTPIGIVTGACIGATLTGKTDTLFEASFDAIGAGTFVYIAVLDIVRTEFDSPMDHLRKWLAATAGFALMAVLAIWI